MRAATDVLVIVSLLTVFRVAPGDVWAQDVVPEDAPEGAHPALGPEPAVELPVAASDVSMPAQTAAGVPPPRPASAPVVGPKPPEPRPKSRTGLGVGLLVPGVLMLAGGVAVVASTAGDLGRGSSSSIGPDFSGMPTALGGLMIFGGVGLSVAGVVVLATSPSEAPAPQAAFVVKPGWAGVEGAF